MLSIHAACYTPLWHAENVLQQSQVSAESQQSGLVTSPTVELTCLCYLMQAAHSALSYQPPTMTARQMQHYDSAIKF